MAADLPEIVKRATGLSAAIAADLAVAGGILRFEWFINHTEKYERWTRTEIIRIESKEGLQPAQEPEADSDPHSFPTLAKGTAGP